MPKDNAKTLKEQMKKIDKEQAKIFASKQREYDKNLSNMLDRQQEMLANFYKESSDEGRDSIRRDMESRQQMMKEQLDEMRRSAALYRKYMNQEDRKAFQEMYLTTEDGMKRISKEMSRRFDDIGDDFGGMTETFSEKINGIADELRELGMSLNLDAMVQGMEDTVDSYLENVRQLRSRTNNTFDIKAFSKTTGELTDDLRALNRSQASETVSNIIKDFGMKNMEEVADYAQTIAAAEIMGMSKDDLEGIMWKDRAFGADGKFLRNFTNMAKTLEENDSLYVSSTSILNAINGNIDAIYGLNYKDSKKATQMAASLAALEALSENEANEGVTTMTQTLQSWQKLTLPELFEDDKAVQFSNMMGMSMQELQTALQDPEKLGNLIENFQNQLSTMSDYQLNAWKDVMGFDYVYQMRELVAADTLKDDWDEIAKTAQESFAASENDSTLDMLAESSNETVTGFQGFLNGLSNNPIAKALEWFGDTFDISLANAANAVTMASAFLKGGSAVIDFFKNGSAAKVAHVLSGLTSSGIGATIKGALSGFFSSGKMAGVLSFLKGLGGTFTGFIGKVPTLLSSISTSLSSVVPSLGGIVSNIGGFASNIVSGIGAKLGGLGSALSGGSTGLSGLASAASAIAPLAGGVWALVDGVSGFNKSVEWLGSDSGNSISGKISSAIGGALGGTGSGLSGGLVGAAKGALIGAVGGPVGAAIGGAVGGVLGAIGGERIAKFAKSTLDLVGDVVSESFNVMDSGVKAVSGVLNELGPVGEMYGQVLEGSWNAVMETKDAIVSTWTDPNKGIVAKIAETAGALFSGVGSILQNVIESVKNFGGKVWDGVKSFFGFNKEDKTADESQKALPEISDESLLYSKLDSMLEYLKIISENSYEDSLDGVGSIELLSQMTSNEAKSNDKFLKEFKKNGIFGNSLKSSSKFSNKILGALFGSGSQSSGKSTGLIGSVVNAVSGFFSGSGSGSTSSGGGTGSYTSTSVTQSAPTASGSGNASSIWNYFSSKGLSSAGIAGIMGNMQAESGLNPTNLQNSYEKSLGMSDASYTAAVDNGSYGNFVNDAAGYGLVQWTYHSLKQDLLDTAKSKGTSIGDLNTQLDTLWMEISKNSGLMNTLKSATSVKEASDAFMLQYERPADQSTGARNTRASYAQGFFDKFGASYAVGTPWIPGDQVALVHQGEMVVPANMNPLNTNSSTVPLSSYDDTTLIETLKWMVHRLESKLDAVIASSGTQSRRKALNSQDIDMALSF